MLIWSKIFVFELRPTKFGGLVALPKGFPKVPKKVDQSSNFDPKYFLPRGFLGAILARRNRGPLGLLKFQSWGTQPQTPIFREFFSEFWVSNFDPRNLENERQDPIFYFAYKLRVQRNS